MYLRPAPVIAWAAAALLTTGATAQINVISVDCTPFQSPNPMTSFGPDNTMGMSLQQVDLSNQFNVTEVTPAQFRALGVQALCQFDLIAINNNPTRIDCGSGLGLGTNWHGAVGVQSGGRVLLISHDAARFKIIIPPGGAFFGAGAPGPGVEPFGADEIVRQAAQWAGGGSRTGLVIFNDSARFMGVGGVGWDNPELNLPAAWGISDLDQTGGSPADGGYTDILPAFQTHPVYAGLSDARFGVDSLASFAANIGDGSFHSIIGTHNAGIFTPTEVVVNAGVIDVGGFNVAFGIGANVSPNGPDGTPISLIRDEAPLVDCNNNGIPDDCDIAAGTSPDDNNNGIPDECEGVADRVSGTEKGSLLIFSKVEIRWNAAGDVLQDTFIDLSNDWNAPVFVNMYFVNGDPPAAAGELGPGERAHAGWNWFDVKRPWTMNQPAYWSALTGGPGPDGAALQTFTILDPSGDITQQGRPATDGSGDRVLRGYIIAFATDEDCCPVSWNHLKGDATIVNYMHSTAWEYNAWAFQSALSYPPGTPIGACDDDSATLALDGLVYVQPYALLLLDFYAPVAGLEDTHLTLHPVDADLRQEGNGPISTKASFVIWNEDETQFTGLHRCITCWDQQLLSLYTEGGVQNHFLSLQTDKGKARIDGIASTLCTSNCCLDRGDGAGCDDMDCQESVCMVDPFCCSMRWDLGCAEMAVDLCDTCTAIQIATPLLGVAAKELSFGADLADAAGFNLIGMGVEPTSIYYDPAGSGGSDPPTLTTPTDAVHDVLELLNRTLGGRR